MYTCVNVYVYNTYILIYNTYIHICMYTLVASLSVRKFGSVSFFKQTTNKYAEAAPLRKYANIDFWFRLETKSILKKINIDFVSNQNQWQCAQKTTLLSTFCLLTLFFFPPRRYARILYNYDVCWSAHGHRCVCSIDLYR